MNYVYYFTNAFNEIIYVGKTGNIRRRMQTHFGDGHLPEECYQSVNQIFYAETGNGKYDNEIIETILIDKYKPKYNTEKVFNERYNKLNFKLPELRWKELWIRYRNDAVIVHFSDPGYECFDLHELKQKRIENLILFNITLLRKRSIFVREMLSSLPDDVVKDIIDLLSGININYAYSSIDIPLRIEEYDSAHTAFQVDSNSLVKEYLVESELIIPMTDEIYAVPLYTKDCLEYCNNKYTADTKC